MVLVFHTLPPPPRAIGAHEQHLARPVSLGHQQRQSAVLIGVVFVDSQHFGPRFGPQHRGIPLKARQVVPHVGVLFHRVSQFGEQTPPAQRGEFEVIRKPRTPTVWLTFVEHHRIELLQFSIEQAELAAFPTGQKNQPAGLLFDQTQEQPAFFFGELPFPNANIAQEHHVEFRQLVQAIREFLDVVGVAATALFEQRME